MNGLSNTDFAALVAQHDTYSSLARAVGTKSHCAVRDRAAYLGLDTTHYVGRSWKSGRAFGPAANRLDIECKKRVTSYDVISRGIFDRVCSDCGITKWRGHPVPLELDHINGNNRDNRLENLRLLCCNCHGLTPTWRGRNWGVYKQRADSTVD